MSKALKEILGHFILSTLAPCITTIALLPGAVVMKDVTVLGIVTVLALGYCLSAQLAMFLEALIATARSTVGSLQSCACRGWATPACGRQLPSAGAGLASMQERAEFYTQS